MPELELWKPGVKYLGLVAAGGKDVGPPGSLRRNKGIQRIYDGVLRSRFGSTVHANSTSGATLPIVFAGNLHFLKGTDFYRLGSIIQSGMTSSSLTYTKMPANIGAEDYLFIAGNTPMLKVSAGGTVTNWGIQQPVSSPTLADTGAGTLAAGTYRYWIAFRNSGTGSRSNAEFSSIAITIAVNRRIGLTNIPVSADTQVDSREIYRTTAGGTVGFLLATIADNTTTTYTDTGGVPLSAFQLQTDNLPPGEGIPGVGYADAVGPFAGRMWWTRRTSNSTNVYFSPIGRPESVAGFLTVSTTDEQALKLVIWNGLWLFTTKGIRQVVSTTAQPLEVRGAVGIANAPTTLGWHFVQPTPMGIIYLAEDGPRVFDGSTSRLLSRQALGLFFRDPALVESDLVNSTFAESVFARDEYILSNGSTAIAFNVQEQTWRNVGLAAIGLTYDPPTDTVYVTTNTKILKFEEDSITTDDGASIPFEVEFPHTRVDTVGRGLVQFIRLDIDTANRNVTPTLILDGTTVALATIATNGRAKVEIPVLRIGRVLGLRLTGAAAEGQIVVYGAAMEIYTPKASMRTS